MGIGVLKVLIHINFFLDDAMWTGNTAVTFGKLVDAGFTLLAACVVPLVTWLLQYRTGDRVRMDLHVEHVLEGAAPLYVWPRPI